MAKLRYAICGQKNTNLDDLQHMTGKNLKVLNKWAYTLYISEFLHTGDIESINGLQLKYANKTYSYRYRPSITCEML